MANVSGECGDFTCSVAQAHFGRAVCRSFRFCFQNKLPPLGVISATGDRPRPHRARQFSSERTPLTFLARCNLEYGGTSFSKRGSFRSSSNIGSSGTNAGVSGELAEAQAPSFIKQELARFPDDQRFIYYKHVVVSVMQFDDSRVLHA